MSYIEFGANKKLEEVYLSNLINLKDINFSNLKNLKKLFIEGLPLKLAYFGNNNKTIKELKIDNSGYSTTSKSKIKELDLTKLKNLKKLEVGNCKSLCKLNLSKNKRLRNIRIYNNTKLNKIDLSKNKKLKTIYLVANGIEEIKVAKTNVIEDITIIQEKLKEFSTEYLNIKTLTSLYFARTKLKKLDASKFDNLKKISTWKKTKVIYPKNNDSYKIID